MKIKVTFLLDPNNSWIKDQLSNYNFNLSKKYSFKIFNDYKQIKNQDIVFAISHTKILSEKFLNKNKLVLIPHCSKLPKDRGFSPIQNQILKKKNKFYISLIKAVKKVDRGPICLQSSFRLNGTELYDEIRKIQGKEILKIIHKFLIKYPNIKFKNQRGKGNFNKKRQIKDNKLNINKSIKDQFNNLRINNNELYPSYFYFKKKKFILKIFKAE